MTRYEAQVTAALGAVALRPPDAFLWFGRREATGGADGAGAGAREPLVRRIAERLHEDFFSGGSPRPRRGGPVTAPDEGGAFVRALSQANGGRGAWQDGWRIAAQPVAGAVVRVVRPDGLALLAPEEQFRAEDEAAAGAGACAAVLLPKELRGLSPGFYVALGDSGTPPGDALAGLYWSVAAAGAVTLVARVTYALNGAGLAFSFELLDNPARYGRGDAAVLVVARDDVAAVTKLLKPLLRALGPHLAGEAPAFTKPLARGLALAECPTGMRFGEQRCRLLAGAIVAAGEAGASTAEARLAVVRERFAAAGVSLDAPYLQPGSDDVHAGS